MVDKIKPLKIESSALGGTEDDVYPTELDPTEDYIAAKGISYESTDTHRSEIVSNEIAFIDPVNGTKKVSDLIDSVIVEDDGTPLTTKVLKLNFVGATLTEPTTDEITVTIGSGLGALSKNAVSGLDLTWNTVATIAIEEGAFRDSTDAYTISVTSALNLNITASGANGLDTGAEASSTFYAVYVIADTTEVNPVAGLFSVSATSPTLPAGYDIFRRVGWVMNDASSDIMRFEQTGLDRSRSYLYIVDETEVRVLTSGSAIVYSAVVLGAFMPTTSTHAILYVEFKPKNAVNTATIIPKGAALTIENTIFDIRPAAASNSFHIARETMPTDSNQEIEYAVSDVNDILNISVAGFIDEI